MKKRMYHIDGIKGLMCFLIMIGHFWSIYRNVVAGSVLQSNFFDMVKGTFVDKRLLSATFWLYAFLVISGFLLSNTKVRELKELVMKTIKRFLRLFLPILGACAFVFLIQEVIGFATADTKAYFDNSYIRSFYSATLSLQDIVPQSLRAMFEAGCSFNAPFWVITELFISSILIYVCNYVDDAYQKKTHLLPWIFLVIAIFADAHVTIACMAGYLVGYYKEEIHELSEKKHVCFVVMVALYACVNGLYKANTFPKIFDDKIVFIVFYCCMLVLLNRSEFWQNIFSKKIFLEMGKISFGVYALHWPIICSVGLKVLLWGLDQKWKVVYIFAFSFLVSLVCTVVLSIIYRFTVEKLSDVIIKKIPQ